LTWKEMEMKNHWKLTAAAAAMAMASVGGNALAEASYGYDSTGSGTVNATASVKITVTTPKLVVLRVGGTNTTQTSLDFVLSPSIPAVPTVPSATGDSQAVDWTGTAPTFTAAAVGAVTAYLWHNNSGNASLSCSVTTAFAGTLADTDVLVASGAGMAHPGANTSCATPTTGLARNTVYTGTWTYSLKASVLTSAMPGSDFEVVTYTATTL
jgi:hypothetical protein